MKTVNRVTLLGNLTRDSELKATQGGSSVCTFGLATNRSWKDTNGEVQTQAEFHNVVVWGKFADVCHPQLKKGKALYVEGYLKTRQWPDAESGKQMYRTEIVADNIIYLSPREEAPAEDAAPADAAPTDRVAGESY